MKLVDGKLETIEPQEKEKKKILYLKHPSWQEPTSKERGVGGINAIGRVIYNHKDYLENIGYQVDLLWDKDLTHENAKEYDFIHCSFWFQCLRLIRMGIPYILNIHDNNPLLEKKGSEFYDVYSKCIEQSLVTVAQTEQTREQWDHLSHKIVTVPVPIDTDYLTIDESVDREDFVLCVGAIQAIKGHRFLAKACNELKLRMIIIGNPDEADETEELKKYINRSDGRIEWIDKSIPFNELLDYYRRCRVFAMTTKMDVPGLVYLEALSCGANVVATEQGDYKSKNPKISRCTLENESIKDALMKAWFMENDTNGREYVVNKHHPEKCVERYIGSVYNVDWTKEYNLLDMSSSLYDMDFSGEGAVSFLFGNSPFDVDDTIKYNFDVYEEGSDSASWQDEDIMPNGRGVYRTFSSGWIEPEMGFRYEIKLNDILVETGKGKNDTVDRTIHVNDFEFLINSKSKIDVSLDKYIDNRIKGKQWELYTNPIEKDGTSLEMYSWPLVNKDFCDELIREAEKFGQWTTERHDNYPTHDILLNSFGYGEIWDSILHEYAHPVSSYVWGLAGFVGNMKNESFIAKYDLESENAQTDLSCHHDASDYTFVVSLNEDYEGGGTWFPRQKYLVNRPVGEIVVHPTITHKHGARAVTSGIRYVLITFCKKI